jgi:hypothetical protein
VTHGKTKIFQSLFGHEKVWVECILQTRHSLRPAESRHHFLQGINICSSNALSDKGYFLCAFRFTKKYTVLN